MGCCHSNDDAEDGSERRRRRAELIAKYFNSSSKGKGANVLAEEREVQQFFKANVTQITCPSAASTLPKELQEALRNEQSRRVVECAAIVVVESMKGEEKNKSSSSTGGGGGSGFALCYVPPESTLYNSSDEWQLEDRLTAVVKDFAPLLRHHDASGWSAFGQKGEEGRETTTELVLAQMLPTSQAEEERGIGHAVVVILSEKANSAKTTAMRLRESACMRGRVKNVADALVEQLKCMRKAAEEEEGRGNDF